MIQQSSAPLTTQVTPNRTVKQAQLRDNLAHGYAEVVLNPITVSLARAVVVETQWKHRGNAVEMFVETVVGTRA